MYDRAIRVCGKEQNCSCNYLIRHHAVNESVELQL